MPALQCFVQSLNSSHKAFVEFEVRADPLENTSFVRRLLMSFSVQCTPSPNLGPAQ